MLGFHAPLVHMVLLVLAICQEHGGLETPINVALSPFLLSLVGMQWCPSSQGLFLQRSHIHFFNVHDIQTMSKKKSVYNKLPNNVRQCTINDKIVLIVHNNYNN
jgi:hypothetical protein